jgi:hypothetical protein
MKLQYRSGSLSLCITCAALLTLLIMPLAASAAALVSRYSFNETSGTSAADSIGGYTATLANSNVYFNGAGSVILNRTNSYISLPTAQLSNLTVVSFDAWFTYNIPSNNVHLFSIYNGSSGSGGSYMRYSIRDNGNGHGGTNYFEGIISWSGNVLHGGMILPTVVTNHVTVVYDPTTYVKNVYVNGVLTASLNGDSSSVPPFSSYPKNVFYLGRSPWSSDPYLAGAINEFRVYSGALTDAEVATNELAGPDSVPTIGVGVPFFSPSNTAYAGESRVISCGISGPVTGYHWEWDSGTSTFSAIAGANSLSYTQDTTGLSGGYQYRFIATNASSSVTSSVVTLTVSAASAPFITTDTAISPAATMYVGGTATFTAAFDGNHPMTNQWQVDKGTGYTSIPGATATSLTLTNVQLTDAGNYRLAVTNASGANASTPTTLTVHAAALAKFQWSAPVPFNGLSADQILTNVTGYFIDGAAFGATARSVTLGNGRIVRFTTDASIAAATGGGTSTGAYPAGTGLTTSNADFDAVLNAFSWDGGPKTVYINGLQTGEQYSVQLFGVDDRNVGGSESNRLANYQDPNDAGNVSATFKMGDNVYVIGTFIAANSTEMIQMNLPTGNAGSINALVLRALSFVPPNQPPTITAQPQATAAFAGHPASFTVAADSYVLPGYQWQTGPSGGPFTNLPNGGVIVGATSNVLVLTNAAAYNGTQFQVVVTNPAGSVTSDAATLTVLAVPPASGSVSAAVKALSPVAYWPLNETNDPSTGLAGVYDAAGTFDGAYLTAAQNAFNGIVGVQPADGFPTFATNQGALKSTANTDQSWATTPPLNLNTNTATIGMWIYPDGIQPSAVGLYVNRNSGTIAGLGYYETDRLGYKWNNDGAETWGFNSGPLIPTNIWSYVALAVTPTNAILYLYNTNGLQSATNVVTHNNMTWGGSQSNIRIGCDNSVATTFNGKIDEVVVFSRALTPSEILQAAGIPVAPTLSIQSVGSQINLTWSSGILLEATNVVGPWTTNANASPYQFTPTASQKFYRVQVP